MQHSVLPRAWGLLLDLVYPPRCGGCDRRGTWFCDDCRSRVEAPTKAVTPHGLAALVCAGAFEGPIRTAIHRLKYENDTPLARPLAALLAEAMSRRTFAGGNGDSDPVLVPVPLHKARLRTRGFNQSDLLAEELSRLTGWRVERGLLRVRDTASQVGLSAHQRRDNVAGAFDCAHERIPPKVILVDDVCTTGATLAECAAALRAKGAETVFGAVVAKAVEP